MRIFSIILPVRVSGLLFSELILTFTAYLIALFPVLGADAQGFLLKDSGIPRLLLVSLSILLGLFVNNLYANTRLESRVLLVLKLCNVMGIALVVQGLLAYASSSLTLPRVVMIGGSALAFVTLLLWRLFYGGVFLKMIGQRNILFVGEDSLMDEIAARVTERPEMGFAVCGYISSANGSAGAYKSLGKWQGAPEDLEQTVARCKPDRIVVGAQQAGESLPVAPLLRMSQRGILIEEAGTTYESVCGRVCSETLRPSQIIFDNELASHPGSLALQSIYTNLLALSAIAIASPLLIVISLAVKLTSRGPLFDPDPRVGQHGIPFNLNRFRCHRRADGQTGQSLDALLTPVGRVLIALHLSKLPRVFNLLRGEITLVGPRPERPEFADELARYFAYYPQRHAVKPGLTGWSQINTEKPRLATDPLLQLEYDLYYTKHISLALDAYILLHGIRRLLPFARH